MAMRFGIVVHGGVGSSTRLSGACRAIATQASQLLEKGATSLETVVESVRLLEDDGRFNAGRGAALRLDGETVEMDASVMDSRGRIAAVIAVRDVQNPILLARALMATPHVALAGEGASLFARRLNLPPSPPVSERVLKRYEKTRQLFERGEAHRKDARWRSAAIPQLWNFKRPYGQVFSSDTVGAIALDIFGVFAVASSTGGASPMLNGRVGDTAMIGCGFYAGPLAAVAVTGVGEEIIRRMLAKTVYDMIEKGVELEAACGRAVETFPPSTPVGLIAISGEGIAVRANRRMAEGSVSKGTAAGAT
jgi:beta-aspartyl-peptidase (threonine type)